MRSTDKGGQELTIGDIGGGQQGTPEGFCPLLAFELTQFRLRIAPAVFLWQLGRCGQGPSQ